MSSKRLSIPDLKMLALARSGSFWVVKCVDAMGYTRWLGELLEPPPWGDPEFFDYRPSWPFAPHSSVATFGSRAIAEDVADSYNSAPLKRGEAQVRHWAEEVTDPEAWVAACAMVEERDE